jgi:hypothetical protein
MDRRRFYRMIREKCAAVLDQPGYRTLFAEEVGDE